MWSMPIGEVLELPAHEVMLGVTYLAWKAQKEKEAIDKARRKSKTNGGSKSDKTSFKG